MELISCTGLIAAIAKKKKKKLSKQACSGILKKKKRALCPEFYAATGSLTE